VLRRVVVLSSVLALIALVGCSSRDDQGATPTPSPSVALTASDTGVTPDEIRIAVVADVDNPIAPGLFQESVDGVKAWAAYQNSKGGLAGRQVVVDFYDSKLNPDEWRNAVIKACENTLAMVGTTSAADVSVAEMTACGIPEIAQVATTSQHRGVSTSFGILNGKEGDVLVAPQQWFKEEFGAQGCCKGIWLLTAGTPGALESAQQVRKAAVEQGYQFIREFPLNARDPNYAPYVSAIKSSGANYVGSITDFNQWALLRREAKLQGADSVLVWDCPVTCYDPAFLQVGGDAIEGQYVSISFLPFEDRASAPAVNTYLTELKKINPDAQTNGFSVGTWMGGLLFGQAVEQVVADHGANGLNRANLIAALREIHDFDADGLTGPTDVGAKAGTTCVVVMQVKDGKFVRAHPAEGLDCAPDNVVSTP
jgi:ABC-type branched-subunit amino acid transport system substrate-binding protein